MDSQGSNISREQNAETPQGLVFSNKAKHDLNQARKWAKFLAVIYFVAAGFSVLASLLMIASSGGYRRYGYGGYDGLFVLLVVVYLAGAASVFFPALFLNKFSNKARDAAEYNDSTGLENSMRHLFSYANASGIISIIFIVLLAFAFLSGAAGGLF